MHEAEVLAGREGMRMRRRHGRFGRHSRVADGVRARQLSEAIPLGNVARMARVLVDLNRPSDREEMDRREPLRHPRSEFGGIDVACEGRVAVAHLERCLAGKCVGDRRFEIPPGIRLGGKETEPPELGSGRFGEDGEAGGVGAAVAHADEHGGHEFAELLPELGSFRQQADNATHSARLSLCEPQKHHTNSAVRSQ